MNLQSQTNQALCLLDEDFLATLSEQKERELFARVIALNVEEEPIDQIEGRITSGSINIDGSSVIRRTCSLSMISDNIDINDFYWGIKTKFKLEIGLKNTLTNQYAPGPESAYPEIMWFPQGYYIVSTFSTSISTNGCTISIQGKDKMCMLNGDLGGQLYASIDFGTEQETIYGMEEVNFETQESSSDGLKDYYLKLEKTDTNIPSLIHKENNDNPLYIFIYRKDNNGLYYKNGNIYYKNDNNIIGYKTYDCYKAIEDPDEIYKEGKFLNSLEYQANKYYYKKRDEDKYYILDTAKTLTSGRVYYEVKTLYKRKESISIKKKKIEDIIREAVHTYAKEPYYNIIINDLDDYGLEQLTYKGDKDLYALYNVAFGQFTNLALAGQTGLDDVINRNDFIFKSLNESTNSLGSYIRMKKEKGYSFEIITNEEYENLTDQEKTLIYTIAKFSYGMDIGYRLTDLTYAGDLITSIGDTLTSMLDKIKQMLGDFEYFYDLDGRFVFQRKKTYVETSWSQLTDNEDETYVTYGNDKHKFSFNFEGNRLISSISNNPALNNLKNDYVVWGKRKGISGQELPIHARYAIDKKPVYYKTLDGRIYTTNTKEALKQIENTEIDNSEILNFSLLEWYPYVGLTKPIKNNRGIWSAGWWNIKDWIRYHTLLTGKAPSGQISNYLKNGVPIYTIATLQTWTEEERAFCENHSLIVYLVKINKNTNKTEAIIPSSETTWATLTEQLYDNNFFIYNPQFIGKTAEELINLFNEVSAIQWLREHNIYIVDWREIIYQMALDFFLGQGCGDPSQPKLYISEDNEHFEEMTNPDHFLYEVGKRNPYYYPTGKTGYEQYYTDMQGFWRQLYDPEYIPEIIYDKGHYEDSIETNSSNTYYKRTKVWTSPQISDCNIEYYVYKDRNEIQKQISDLRQAKNDIHRTNEEKKVLEQAYNTYQKYALSKGNGETEEILKRLYWNRNVFEQPENLNFWIDFLDSDLELAQFSVSQVGDRTKVVNEDKAGSIIYSQVPNLILYQHPKKGKIEGEEVDVEVCDTDQLRREVTEKSGYTFIYLPKGFSQYFTISHRNLSVKDKIDTLLYQYGYCTESISLTSIPIYYLQPNTRIYVYDKESGIDGEYLVDKLSLSLAYNGTMSITATKAPQRLY